MILHPDDRWEKNIVSSRDKSRVAIQEARAAIGHEAIGICATVMQSPDYVDTQMPGLRWLLLERNEYNEIFSIQLRSGLELRVVIDRQYGLPDTFSVNGGEWEQVRNWDEISTLIGGMRGLLIVGPLQFRENINYLPGISPERGLNEKRRKWSGRRMVA